MKLKVISSFCIGEQTSEGEETAGATRRERQLLPSFERSFDYEYSGRGLDAVTALGPEVIDKRAIKQGLYLASDKRNQLANFHLYDHRARRTVRCLIDKSKHTLSEQTLLSTGR